MTNNLANVEHSQVCKWHAFRIIQICYWLVASLIIIIDSAMIDDDGMNGGQNPVPVHGLNMMILWMFAYPISELTAMVPRDDPMHELRAQSHVEPGPSLGLPWTKP